ncbi:hypothetical protein [Photobacterium iliopiscarium]|uniref:competence protein CoiA family protein n=1 Tax=Photobacterium iliopiscarium TaxID=56192 RepID=UPI001E32F72A|nr:hypothetical protein [Photobacterium iliopiscarium]MCD9485902.1 hypothetical protein [Photobacterium iliopiscarium]MCF2242599.1 hypothetical protein [Photobacterium iliopiscarium]
MKNNYIISRPLWEVFVGEQNKVTTVGRLLTNPFKPVDVLYQETKAKIHKAKHDNDTHYLRCCYCNSSLYGRRNPQQPNMFTYYFCHHTPTEDQREKVLSCPYYTGVANDLYKDYCSDVENEWRTSNKYNVIEVLERSPLISLESIVNSHFIFSKDNDRNTKRKPDIYFEDLSGNKWAIEFYRSWITTEVVYSRELFFRDQSINLLWLFPVENNFNSESIADYVMFGSNNAYLSIRNNNRPANNVFYFGEKELQSTIQNNELTVSARYPKISIVDNNQAEVEFFTKEVLISTMSLAPEHRLPWAVDTTSNYTQYRNDIVKRLIQLRKAYHYCKTHLTYSDVSPSVLSSLEQVVSNVNGIDLATGMEKTINRYILRLLSYIQRSGSSNHEYRNVTAKLLKSAYVSYRTLKSKPLRKVDKEEVHALDKFCYLTSTRGISSVTYNNISNFQRDLAVRFELYQQQQLHRKKEALSLVKFRKLYNRMRSYDLFPMEHLPKVYEIRRGFDFFLVSPQTGRVIATKNSEIDSIILKTKRHDAAKKLRISDFYEHKKGMVTAKLQVDALLNDLDKILKQNHPLLKEYGLARLYTKEVTDLEIYISKYVVTNDDAAIISSRDLTDFNETKTGCEELIRGWWNAFSVIRSDAEKILLTDFNDLNNNLDTLIVKIRSGDCDRSDLTNLHDKYSIIEGYLKNDEYLSSLFKQNRFKWDTAYTEAYRLLNPIWASSESIETNRGVSINTFKRTHRVTRSHNATVLKMIRVEQNKIRSLCNAIDDSKTTASKLKGIRLNLNGIFGQFKISVKSLNKEHLNTTSKRVIDKVVNETTTKCLNARQSCNDRIENHNQPV